MRKLGEFQPDIFHLVDPVILGATGLAAARFFNVPLVSSYHTNLAAYCEHFGFSLLTRPMWSYNRFVHSQCSLTFCPSPSTAAMLRLEGFEHLRIWPRGVDTAIFKPERRSSALRTSWLGEEDSKKTVLLYVGRVSWEKNLRLLMQAYRNMDHSNCHLVIVGEGPASLEMQQELAGLPVTFTGYLMGEALATVYASSDVFAFPSRTETFGQVVLEAMASGLPVVGLIAEGVCDLVENERTGLLVPDAHIQEDEQVVRFRTQLERLIQDTQKRQEMSNAALIEAQRRSWYEAMECLVRGYQEVVESTRPLVAA